MLLKPSLATLRDRVQVPERTWNLTLKILNGPGPSYLGRTLMSASAMASSNNPSRIGEFLVAERLRVVGLTHIDMNDESNLELYSRLLLFKNDVLISELLSQNSDYAMQRILQPLAH